MGLALSTVCPLSLSSVDTLKPLSVLRKILIGLFIVLLILGYLVHSNIDKLKPYPTIIQSPTSIIGINHIGLSVLDLDKMVDFYTQATGFEVVDRLFVSNDPAAAALYDLDSISYERAIIQGPNMLLELTEYNHQTDTIITKTPPYGPGMTHTCYQTAEDNSGYLKFKNAGAEMLSRGTEPIDLGGYGVTYAYGYDPEGNMMELEQMSNTVIRLKIGKKYSDNHKMWMTQVAIMTSDLPRLTDFYQKVLEIEPYRVNSYSGIPTMDQVVDIENVSMDASWFAIDTQDKKMELMQYSNPATPNTLKKRKPTDRGYTFSYEVADIQKEYERLKNKGIEFLSAPQDVGHFREVFAYDVDGNIFSLRQAIDTNSPYSLNIFNN